MLLRVGVVVLLGLALPAQADKMAEASMALCEKVKECALQQIAEKDMAPEMRQMMQPMLNNMCESVGAQIPEVPTGHPLYQPALACIQSMASLGCTELQDGDNGSTPECEAYREQAGKYEQNQ